MVIKEIQEAAGIIIKLTTKGKYITLDVEKEKDIQFTCSKVNTTRFMVGDYVKIQFKYSENWALQITCIEDGDYEENVVNDLIISNLRKTPFWCKEELISYLHRKFYNIPLLDKEDMERLDTKAFLLLNKMDCNFIAVLTNHNLERVYGPITLKDYSRAFNFVIFMDRLVAMVEYRNN